MLSPLCKVGPTTPLDATWKASGVLDYPHSLLSKFTCMGYIESLGIIFSLFKYNERSILQILDILTSKW